MDSSTIQLLVLAGVAIFLVLKLKATLGSREGFEKPPAPIGGGVVLDHAKANEDDLQDDKDHDILDHVEEGSILAQNAAAIKKDEPSFRLTDFIAGARSAYEMVVMAFDHGDLSTVKAFLDEDVAQAFQEALEQRQKEGISITSHFVGMREMKILGIAYDATQRKAEITVRYVADINRAVTKDAQPVQPASMITQRDIWTYARDVGSKDPNWMLSATGD